MKARERRIGSLRTFTPSAGAQTRVTTAAQRTLVRDSRQPCVSTDRKRSTQVAGMFQKPAASLRTSAEFEWGFRFLQGPQPRVCDGNVFGDWRVVCFDRSTQDGRRRPPFLCLSFFFLCFFCASAVESREFRGEAVAWQRAKSCISPSGCGSPSGGGPRLAPRSSRHFGFMLVCFFGSGGWQ